MRMTRTTRTQEEYRDKGEDQDVDNEGHRTTRRDEYKGNKEEDEDNKDEED